MKKIIEIADSIGLSADDIELYGNYKAKIKFEAIEKLKDRPDGQLILVSAITPTPAGEGKTTVSIGLSLRLFQNRNHLKPSPQYCGFS